MIIRIQQNYLLFLSVLFNDAVSYDGYMASVTGNYYGASVE
jgi:hypothetical protein